MRLLVKTLFGHKNLLLAQEHLICDKDSTDNDNNM